MINKNEQARTGFCGKISDGDETGATDMASVCVTGDSHFEAGSRPNDRQTDCELAREELQKRDVPATVSLGGRKMWVARLPLPSAKRSWAGEKGQVAPALLYPTAFRAAATKPGAQPNDCYLRQDNAPRRKPEYRVVGVKKTKIDC